MLSILRKEINTFFTSPIGYLVVAIFLLLNGLLLWIFNSDFNILNYGFASLTPFFTLAPWLFIFLIPAVTMRSFADEKKMGTLELLFTKPISINGIILGKFLGAIALILIALVPSMVYIYTIYQLGDPIGNLDFGSTLGSYFGLIFIIMAYTAIGIFASSLTDNQIVAFLIAVFICFICFIGFESLSEIFSSNILERLGMNFYYKSISRGVLDTRDLIYFISITLFFLIFTKLNLQGTK